LLFRHRGTSRALTRSACLAALILALTVLVACGDDDDDGAGGGSGGGDSASASSGGVKEGLKLAFFSVGGNNTYLKAGMEGARAAAKEYGASIDVFNGEFDSAKQLNQVMTAVASGDYDGFVIEPNNSQQLCSAVKATINADIPVGITNVPACDAPYDGVLEDTAIFVGGQSPEVYRTWLSQGKDTGSGKFGVLNGPAVHGNTTRAREVLDEIEPDYPDWDEVGFDYTEYQASVALAKTQTMLQKHPDIKAFYSSYAGHTPGIISAVKAAGAQDQVKIYDLGGDKTMFEALKKGDIESTLVYLPFEEQYRAVQAVVAEASGLDELDGVKVGEFWDLTQDPKLEGLEAFVTKDRLKDYEAIGLPEY
jgi:ribose transport system substrate-binding protein